MTSQMRSRHFSSRLCGGGSAPRTRSPSALSRFRHGSTMLGRFWSAGQGKRLSWSRTGSGVKSVSFSHVLSVSNDLYVADFIGALTIT